MKAQSVLAICCGVLLAGQLAGEADPFAVDPFAVDQAAGEQKLDDPEEVALLTRLEKTSRLPNAPGVSSNGDGTCSADVHAYEKQDLTVLKGLPVREMEIMGCMDLLVSGDAMDLSPLAGLPLESLWIYKVPVKDLSPLKGSGLKRLSVIGCPVSDLSPLKGLPLTELSVWLTEVSDISPLKGMPLKHLNIDVEFWAWCRDLTPLDGMELESLQFQANRVTKGIEVVRRMKSLKEINRKTPDEFWKEYDADGPAREVLVKAGEVLTKTGLKFVSFDIDKEGAYHLWFRGDDIIDPASLKGLPLGSLDFRESKIFDLRPLTDLSFKSLSIKSPVLTDISPLRGTSIKGLHLTCDNLTDLSPLREMKVKSLSIKCPKITDLSVIHGLPLEVLNIARSGVTDLNALEGMSLERIYLDPERITKGMEVLRGMKSLKWINFCEVDQFFEYAGKVDSSDVGSFAE